MKAFSCAAALAATLLVASTASAQTQTITPGMSEDEVRSVFGSPAGTRSVGIFTYYFYKNGWEEEAGFPDLVILQGGQVIDVVLRATWRDYSGESSSPKGIAPRQTLGFEHLELPGRLESVAVRPARLPGLPDIEIPVDLPAPDLSELPPPPADENPPPVEALPELAAAGMEPAPEGELPDYAPALSRSTGARRARWEVGTFGNYTNFDDLVQLEDKMGAGGRLGFFLLSRIELEAALGITSTTGTSAPIGDVTYVPVRARLLYNQPLFGGLALVLGPSYVRNRFNAAGTSSSDNGYGGLLGMRLNLSRRFALRVDGTMDYFDASGATTGSERNLGLRPGLIRALGENVIAGTGAPEHQAQPRLEAEIPLAARRGARCV